MKKLSLVACLFALVLMLALPAAALAKTGSKLTASLDTKYEHYDYAPTLTGTLKTSAGKALKSQTIYLYRNGVKIGSKKTNSAGKVAFSVPTADGDNQDFWTLSYSASSKYKASKSKQLTTMVDWHVWMWAVPVAEDVDADGNDEYVLRVNLEMFEGQEFGWYTTGATVRTITEMGSSTNLYPVTAAVGAAYFTAPADGNYTFTAIFETSASAWNAIW